MEGDTKEYTMEQKISFKLFQQEQKVILKNRYPFLSLNQICRKVKENWNKLENKEKMGYTKTILTPVKNNPSSRTPLKGNRKSSPYEKSVGNISTKEKWSCGTPKTKQRKMKHELEPEKPERSINRQVKLGDGYENDFLYSPMMPATIGDSPMNPDSRSSYLSSKTKGSKNTPQRRKPEVVSPIESVKGDMLKQRNYLKTKLPASKKVTQVVDDTPYKNTGILKNKRSADTPKSCQKGPVTFCSQTEIEQYSQETAADDDDSDDEFSNVLIRRADCYDFDDIDHFPMCIEDEGVDNFKKYHTYLQNTLTEIQSHIDNSEEMSDCMTPFGENMDEGKESSSSEDTVPKSGKKARASKACTNLLKSDSKAQQRLLRSAEKKKEKTLVGRKELQRNKMAELKADSQKSSEEDDSVETKILCTDFHRSDILGKPSKSKRARAKVLSPDTDNTQDLTSGKDNSQQNTDSTEDEDQSSKTKKHFKTIHAETKAEKASTKQSQKLSKNSKAQKNGTCVQDSKDGSQIQKKIHACDISVREAQKSVSHDETPSQKAKKRQHQITPDQVVDTETYVTPVNDEALLQNTLKQIVKSPRKHKKISNTNIKTLEIDHEIEKKKMKKARASLLEVMDPAGDAKNVNMKENNRYYSDEKENADEADESDDSYTIEDAEYNSQSFTDEDDANTDLESDEQMIINRKTKTTLMQALHNLRQTTVSNSPVLSEEASPCLLSPALSGISQLSRESVSSAASGSPTISNLTSDLDSKKDRKSCRSTRANKKDTGLCEMFQDLTPPQKSSAKLTRRLVASAKRETYSNFKNLFTDSHIF